MRTAIAAVAAIFFTLIAPAGAQESYPAKTITMIVRAFALGQIQLDQAKKLFAKEMSVALANGVIWGGILGLIAWGLYSSPALGMVMMLAMTLNLLLAAIMGVLIPVALVRFGRDPALGSSVMITPAAWMPVLR